MHPISFKGQNVIYGEENQKQKPIPAFKSQDDNGVVVVCWKVSIWEALTMLFRGRVWTSTLTSNKPLDPFKPTADRDDVLDFSKAKTK